MKALIKLSILFCLFLLILNIFLVFGITVNAAIFNNQEIENGIYEIETKISPKKVLDVSEASNENKANIQIWDRCNVLQQRYKITYLGSGYYSLKSVKTGKVLDVSYASLNKGANVWQYEENNTDAQKWKIEKQSDGYYYLTSKCNGLVLTISGLNRDNGANIEVNEKINLDNQKFVFRKIETIIGTKTLENGIYTIHTLVDLNKVLDIAEASKINKANLQIWEFCNVPQQKFYIKYENGYYTLRNINSGKLIDVSYGNIQKGTNVWQYEENNTDAQKWVINKTSDGYYNIKSKQSRIYLDVKGGETINGTNVQMNIDLNSESNRQKFIFKKEEENSGTVKNGIYEIVTKNASNMVLDVLNGEKGDNVNVQIWADSNVTQQKFEIKNIGAGLYKIICKRSGKALTVDEKAEGKFANVYQYTYKESANQLWKIQKSNDTGYFNIVSYYNEKYLSLENGKTENGTNVRVYNNINADSQKFSLEQRIYGIDVSHWQNEIDFKTLYSYQKIDFIIIRAGQGTTLKDKQFERNYLEAKKYNIPTGVYLYAKAQSVEDAKKEAKNLVNMLKGKSFELPIYYDIEEHENLDNITIMQMIVEFYKIIKFAGYKPGLYASKYYLIYKMDVNKIPTDCSIWVASYGNNDGSVPKDIYKYYGRFDIWQYTSTGKIPGIVGDVDCDIIYKKN